MKNFKLCLLSVASAGLLFTSCQKEDSLEQAETSNLNTTITVSNYDPVPKDLIKIADKLEMNTNFIEYRDFLFPDGTTEKRIYLEDDIVITEAQLREMGDLLEAKQYATNSLVSQGRNISIIGYTGGSQALSSKERTALQWAVNNYNRLSGVSISFTLTFGTGYQNKDMVVYHNPSQSGAGGSAGFPSNGFPHKFVQIYGLNGYDTNVVEHVITHEIGHSVGFRHTDWFSRQSCGQNTNEGTAGVGANHINGTPTGYDASSIMVACFSASEDGEFNGNDITALRAMY